VALNIEVNLATEPPLDGRLMLNAESHVLVQAGDARRVMERQGRLGARDGTPLPFGVVTAAPGAWPPVLDHLPTVEAEGVAQAIMDRDDVVAGTGALWASLQSNADGLVDRWFNRPVGRWLSKLLVHTPVSPNKVSIAATLLGLLSAGLFAVGHSTAGLWGAIVLQFSAIVDCVDGDLARMLFKESRLGKWLDIIGDQVVHVALFVSIGVGLWRTGVDAPVLAMALSAGLGVILSFLVVLRGLRQRAGQNSRLQKLMDATTNRDFSVLLLILAAVSRLEWFLWMAAIGVHVFWMTALVVQLRDAAAPSSLKTHGENRA
jgi:phosphatidylglycerophosphate synthase